MERITQNHPTVAILTNFMDFNPGYSLAGIVVDQAHMLAKKGHRVIVYVNEQFNDHFNDDMGVDALIEKYPLITVKKLTTFMHLVDYVKQDDISVEHSQKAKLAGSIYAADFLEEGVHCVFTHDFIFTGWNLPYADAVKYTNATLVDKGHFLHWYHWVHSVPSAGRDWWNLDLYGLNHTVVFPNKTEIMRVAESFQTTANRVRTIPHIKDIRNWYDFSDTTMDFLEAYPQIMRSEIIQVYPCSTDRMSAKQLDIVIKIFAHIKISSQKKVFLVIANQWATGRQQQENVDQFIELGEMFGLTPDKDFCFTSKTEGLEKGISKRMLRELQLLSDVFIFPTREESFGLVGPESSFSGALPVINKSLTMMFEVMGSVCPAYEFGSFHNDAPAIRDDNYIRAIAFAVLNRLYADESVRTKTWCRLRYNMDSIYSEYYLPIVAPRID